MNSITPKLDILERFSSTCFFSIGALLIIALSGCATIAENTNGLEVGQSDPHEKINRISYNFTDSIDRFLLEPVASVYLEYVPAGAQRSIGNFYDNLAYPNTIINAFLQGKMSQGLKDSLRFIINSTVGLFGLFDMATHMGLAENNEDFGQTLAVWGVNTNEYWFIPVLGPSNPRDAANIPVSIVTNTLFYAGYIAGAVMLAPLVMLGAVDKRARLSKSLTIRDEIALDPYIFVREAYFQQRDYLIFDGNPPLELYLTPIQEEVFQKKIFGGDK